MAVAVQENREVLDQADAVTNFNQGTLNTTDFAEATGSVSFAINIGTDQLFFNGAMPSPGFINLGKEILYVWSSNNATQNSFDAGVDSSHALWLSDGTNQLIVLMAGNDRIAFQHSDGQVQFQCFCFDLDYLDEANTAGRIFEVSGTVAAFDETAITEIGAYYVTLSKALGSGFNTFIDIIRYGGAEDGISIFGLSPEGNYAEVAAADRSKVDGAAHGILREYTAGIYGVQGTIRHGSRVIDSPGQDSRFFDASVVLAFEDRLVDNDKYKFTVDGRADFITEYDLVGSTIASARPGVEIDCSSDNINRLVFNTVVFSALGRVAVFPTDTLLQSPVAIHQVVGCTFDGQGQISPGTIDFQDNLITNAIVVAGEGAVLLGSTPSPVPSPAGDLSVNWANLSFVQGTGLGHAIEILTPGEYTFDNIIFSGFGADETTTAAVYNNSGGDVIINVANGGDTPTVRNGSPGTTVINNPVTVTLTGLQVGTEVTICTSGSPTITIDEIENIGSPTEFSFQVAAAQQVEIIIHHEQFEHIRFKEISFTADSSIPITQRFDRNYSNP